MIGKQPKKTIWIDNSNLDFLDNFVLPLVNALKLPILLVEVRTKQIDLELFGGHCFLKWSFVLADTLVACASL